MDDSFLQQLKKGVLELLVLKLICASPSYGYELLSRLREKSEDFFCLKEGTLYPILYRLEDGGLIESGWQTEGGRAAPKKIYSPTAAGRAECARRSEIYLAFSHTVEQILKEGPAHES